MYCGPRTWKCREMPAAVSADAAAEKQREGGGKCDGRQNVPPVISRLIVLSPSGVPGCAGRPELRRRPQQCRAGEAARGRPGALAVYLNRGHRVGLTDRVFWGRIMREAAYTVSRTAESRASTQISAVFPGVFPLDAAGFRWSRQIPRGSRAVRSRPARFRRARARNRRPPANRAGSRPSSPSARSARFYLSDILFFRVHFSPPSASIAG